MKVINTYYKALQVTLRQFKIIVFIYLLNLVFGLAVGMPFASTIRAAVGDFDAMGPLSGGFDFSLFTDFMRVYGKGVGTIWSVAKWLIPAYLLLYAFLLGGIINMYVKPEGISSLKEFCQKGVEYFWRYVLIAVVFLIQHVVGLLLVLIPLGVLFDGGLENVRDESTFWVASYWAAGIYFVIFMLISLASDQAKIALARPEGSGVLHAILRGWKDLFRFFPGMLGVFILTVLVVVLAYLVYWNVSDLINQDTWVMVIVVLFLQQLINLLRTVVRLTYYGALSYLSANDN